MEAAPFFFGRPNWFIGLGSGGPFAGVTFGTGGINSGIVIG